MYLLALIGSFLLGFCAALLLVFVCKNSIRGELEQELMMEKWRNRGKGGCQMSDVRDRMSDIGPQTSEIR